MPDRLDPAAVRAVTDASLHPFLRHDAWLRLKEATGKPVVAARFRRCEPAPLRLEPGWMVAQSAAPSDRRTLDDHAATARRNTLALTMGRLHPKGGTA